MAASPRFIRHLDEERGLRRSIADAIELLYDRANFHNDDHARIHVGLLALPCGKIVGLIDVQFEDFGGQIVHCVSLPTSGRFRAVRQHSKHSETFDITQLAGAAVDATGQVILVDGTFLRGLDVLPAYLPYEPSDLDWRIVHHVVAIAGAQAHCYRRWPDGLAFTPNDNNFDKQSLRLDCSKLRDLRLPPLKVLYHAITERDSALIISKQKLTDALAMFGIREAKPRPRVA